MIIRRVQVLSLLLAATAALASGQGRLNDKDVEALMRNLKEDAKSFRPVFNSAVSKSTIRKTSREKQAKNTAESFEKKTAALADRFKKNKQAESYVQDVTVAARQLEVYIVDLRLGGQVTSKWDRIHSELNQLSGAFGITEPQARTAYPTDAGNSGVSCLQGVGAERARKLTEECMAVSPATRPPCNAQNSCVLIIDEIKRGCRLLGQTAPIFCHEYTDSQD